MYRRPAVSPLWDIAEADWVDHGPNDRFAIYSAGTSTATDDVVFDKETRLLWERSPSPAPISWDPAIIDSVARIKAGRMGWRLPTIEELTSLADRAHTNPTLPIGHPFINVKLDRMYWSCTLAGTDLPQRVWAYDFGLGSTGHTMKTGPNWLYAWLVRGGYGHDYPY